MQAGAYKKEPVVGGRLLTTRSSLLGSRGQTPSNKVISRHILEVCFLLSAGWASEARDPMHMLQALFVYPTPEGKGQHFGILIQISRYKHEKHSFSAATVNIAVDI